MASLDFPGSGNNYVRGASPLITAPPFTFLCWVMFDVVNASQNFFFLGASTGTTNFWRAICTTIGTMQLLRNDGTGETSESVAGAMTAGVWYHCAIVATSATSAQIFRNGTAATVDTANRAPAGVNRFSMGRKDDGSASGALNGRIGEAALFGSVLTAAQMAAHRAGAPLMGLDPNIAHCWPVARAMGGVVRDMVGGVDLAIGSDVALSEDSAPGLRWAVGQRPRARRSQGIRAA